MDGIDLENMFLIFDNLKFFFILFFLGMLKIS